MIEADSNFVVRLRPVLVGLIIGMPITVYTRRLEAETGAGRLLDTSTGRKPRVAMFCTGGIRCEKSTAYLKAKGFDEVFHLKGGILKYFEEIDPKESKWNGECYVFDERVAVDHELAPSDTFASCPNCGHQLTTKSRCHPAYRPGRRCAFCAEQSPGNSQEKRPGL